jgi:hypothetical protein
MAIHCFTRRSPATTHALPCATSRARLRWRCSRTRRPALRFDHRPQRRRDKQLFLSYQSLRPHSPHTQRSNHLLIRRRCAGRRRGRRWRAGRRSRTLLFFLTSLFLRLQRLVMGLLGLGVTLRRFGVRVCSLLIFFLLCPLRLQLGLRHRGRRRCLGRRCLCRRGSLLCRCCSRSKQSKEGKSCCKGLGAIHRCNSSISKTTYVG